MSKLTLGPPKCWCGKPVTNDPHKCMCDKHRAEYAPTGEAALRDVARSVRDKERDKVTRSPRRRKVCLNATVPGEAADTGEGE